MTNPRYDAGTLTPLHPRACPLFLTRTHKHLPVVTIRYRCVSARPVMLWSCGTFTLTSPDVASYWLVA
jgi:hypothetical protein